MQMHFEIDYGRWGRIRTDGRFTPTNTDDGKTPIYRDYPPTADYLAIDRMLYNHLPRGDGGKLYYGWKECQRLGIPYIPSPVKIAA